MPSLVVLAGCLAGYSETMGYVWPADAQRHRMVDEASQLGVQLSLAKPCLADPLQDLGRGEPGYPLCRSGRRSACSMPVSRLHVFNLPASGPAHAPQDATKV